MAKSSGGIIYVVISMAIMILVGVLVVNSLVNSVTPDDTWSTEANSTWATTQSNIWLAFGLIVIGIIIVAAVAILSMLRGGGGISV